MIILEVGTNREMTSFSLYEIWISKVMIMKLWCVSVIITWNYISNLIIISIPKLSRKVNKELSITWQPLYKKKIEK